MVQANVKERPETSFLVSSWGVTQEKEGSRDISITMQFENAADCAQVKGLVRAQGWAIDPVKTNATALVATAKNSGVLDVVGRVKDLGITVQRGPHP